MVFKLQRRIANSHRYDATSKTVLGMDVITTSGLDTGGVADITKIQLVREGAQSHPIALVSSVRHENGCNT